MKFIGLLTLSILMLSCAKKEHANVHLEESRNKNSIQNESQLIKNIRINKIERIVQNNLLTQEEGCNEDLPFFRQPKIETLNQNLSAGTLTKIVNTGLKVWKIIKENEPQVNIDFVGANAMPESVNHWQELSCWKPSVTDTYLITYENLLGIEVVKFEFSISYTYGGQLDNKGLYLTHVSVIPKVEASWGYTFDANLKVLEPINLYTKEFPIAALELHLNWQVATPLKKSNDTIRFIVQANGFAYDL